MTVERTRDYALVRAATPADLVRLAPLAEEFYAASRFLKRFDLERFVQFWAAMIESGNGVVYLLEDEERITGTLGGVLYPDLYSGELIATEFFWFCASDARGRGLELYRAFEEWAREKGCSEIRMVHLLDSMPERLSVVYRRLGFEPAEVHYTKSL